MKILDIKTAQQAGFISFITVSGVSALTYRLVSGRFQWARSAFLGTSCALLAFTLKARSSAFSAHQPLSNEDGDPFQGLPNEIWYMILNHLSPRDLDAMTRVSADAHNLIVGYSNDRLSQLPLDQYSTINPPPLPNFLLSPGGWRTFCASEQHKNWKPPALNLSGHTLSAEIMGVIPTSVRRLYLCGCTLSAEIMSAIPTSVQYLYLSGCTTSDDIENAIPKSVVYINFFRPPTFS